MIGFIIGTGRCGTTMLAQMLNSHSQVCVPLELQILFEESNNGARLYEIFKEKKNEIFGPEDFMALIEARSPHKFHKYFDYRSFFEKQQYPIRDLKSLVNNLFNEISASRHKKIFFEQTPWQGQRIDVLNELFPDAKYIHMVRDGRDVAISFTRTPWWHDDIGQNLEKWHKEVRQIIDSSKRILRPDRILHVRYEDFVEQPEISLKRICDFLGIDFEDAMLDPTTYIDYGAYSKYSDENISSSSQKVWSKNKNTPTFKGSRYAWKNHSNYDFSTIPPHVAQILNSLGYEAQITRFYTLAVMHVTLKKYLRKITHLTKSIIVKLDPYRIRRFLRIRAYVKQLAVIVKKGGMVILPARLSSFCPVCNKKVYKFTPLPDFYTENTEKYGYIYSLDDAETMNYSAYSCPHCNASDRDRLYALYISRRIIDQGAANISMLEIAPSRPLSEMLKKTGKITLRTADLMMDDVDDRIDITDMNCYADCAFDAFICSHVLEHVPDDKKALRELFRILEPGGWGILMVPIILSLDQIDEDPQLEDIGERWRRFGQDDHVRMYSRSGLVERAEGAGFVVRQYGQEYFGADVFRKNGISAKSILYVVEK